MRRDDTDRADGSDPAAGVSGDADRRPAGGDRRPAGRDRRVAGEDGVGDPSVASLPGFDDGGGGSDPSVADLPGAGTVGGDGPPGVGDDRPAGVGGGPIAAVQRFPDGEVHVQRTRAGLSDLVPGASDRTEERLLDGGPTVPSLDVDAETIERLQEAVARLRETLDEINDLRAEMGVDVAAGPDGATTMRTDLDGPVPGTVELTVSGDRDPRAIGPPEDEVEDDVDTGLTDRQVELVETHRRLMEQFERECQEVLDELSEETLPEEDIFRAALKEYGKHQTLAQALFYVVGRTTEYETVAQYLQSEVPHVGPEGATHVEAAIVAGLVALLTATLKVARSADVSDGDTGENERREL